MSASRDFAWVVCLVLGLQPIIGPDVQEAAAARPHLRDRAPTHAPA